MDLTSVDLFTLAERRLDWADRRQQVLAENVANANTPGYAARDLKPFESLLRGAAVTLAATSPLHLAAASDPLLADRSQAVAERAPDGNAVSLDEQLTMLADTTGMHQLAANLYTKYMGMFRLALGKTG
jgi:flagellar basal-body rod protein FlgB